MQRLMTRRSLLQASLGAAGASLSAGVLGSLISPAARAKSAVTPIQSTKLADDLFLFQGAGSNVVVAKGGEGLLLVDGGSQERASELMKRISAQTGQHRVQQLVNTHWHWDHTGSNEALAKSGAAILAHENTKLWLGTEILSKWEGRTYEPRPANALPTQTFFYDADAKPLRFGEQKLE